MAVDELGPFDGDVPDNFETVIWGKGIKFCSEKVGDAYPTKGGTIDTISGVSKYLFYSYKYMHTRRLVMEHVLNSR